MSDIWHTEENLLYGIKDKKKEKKIGQTTERRHNGVRKTEKDFWLCNVISSTITFFQGSFTKVGNLYHEQLYNSLKNYLQMFHI